MPRTDEFSRFANLSSGLTIRGVEVEPERYGPYTTCYNRFVRWRKIGVWDRLFAAVSRAYDGDLQMVDSSSIRVHQHAANVKKGVRRQPPLATSLLPGAWGARAAD